MIRIKYERLEVYRRILFRVCLFLVRGVNSFNIISAEPSRVSFLRNIKSECNDVLCSTCFKPPCVCSIKVFLCIILYLLIENIITFIIYLLIENRHAFIKWQVFIVPRSHNNNTGAIQNVVSVC